MRTLLVIHPGGLGDVLLSRPALHAIKQAYPAHQLGLLCGQGVGELLKTCGEVNTVFPLELATLAQLFTGPGAVSPPMRDWLAACDRVVAWTTDPDGALRATLMAFGIQAIMVQSAAGSTKRTIAGLHQSDRLLRTVEDLADRDAAVPPLIVPHAVCEHGKSLLRHLLAEEDLGRPLVMMHAGSGSPHKCISPQALRGVVGGLQAAGAVPVLIEGPADSPLIEQVVGLCSKRLMVIRSLSVVELASLLAQADFFIGHDSGVCHLAAVLECPTLALFGPTDPRRWAPRGAHVRVLTGQPCRCHTWPEVQACHEKVCLPIQADILMACQETAPRAAANAYGTRHLVLLGRMC